jgi:hypothetical protein
MKTLMMENKTMKGLTKSRERTRREQDLAVVQVEAD